MRQSSGGRNSPTGSNIVAGIAETFSGKAQRAAGVRIEPEIVCALVENADPAFRLDSWQRQGLRKVRLRPARS